MSVYANTQISPPADEYAYERASVVLWRCLLKDPNVQRNGRRGQRQNGVDIFGRRDSKPGHLVGIQCKQKGIGQALSENEVRAEIEKARTFEPSLREYFIVTTAPDDAALQQLARQVTKDLAENGINLEVHVWGWGTQEERISEHEESRRAFDPTFGAFGRAHQETLEEIQFGQTDLKETIESRFNSLIEKIALNGGPLRPEGQDTTVRTDALEQHLDAEIDELRQLLRDGQPEVALDLFRKLLARVQDTVSGRVLFRIEANIGASLLALGEVDEAISSFYSAYERAPEEPKAVSNKALAMLLEEKAEEVLDFARSAFESDPDNADLASYAIQASVSLAAVDDPLAFIPENLHETAPVLIALVIFSRRRGKSDQWHALARHACSIYPDDEYAKRFAAEAGLDEVLRGEKYASSRCLNQSQHSKLSAARDVLEAAWRDFLASGRFLSETDASLCNNLLATYGALGQTDEMVALVSANIDRAKHDRMLICAFAMVGLDHGSKELVDRCLELLPEDEGCAALHLRYSLQLHNWERVAQVYSRFPNAFPAEDEFLYRSAGALGKLLAEESEPTEAKFTALSKEFAHDARASSLISDVSARNGFEDTSSFAFKAAVTAIDEKSSFAERMMVAQQAYSRDDWAIAASLLYGYVSTQSDSDELRLLVTALANERPVRDRGADCFANLDPALRKLPHYQRAFATYSFNAGDLDAAEEATTQALSDSNDLWPCIYLFALLRRLGRKAEIGDLIESAKACERDGSPEQQMTLAHELQAAGRVEQAIDLGYRCLMDAKDNPHVATAYVGLVLAAPEGSVVTESPVVAPGCWVTYKNSAGEVREFLIIDGAAADASNELSISHPLAKSSLGLKLGDEFEVEQRIGGALIWQITDVKHKYLRELHSVMNDFEIRFPTSDSMHRILLPEGEVQPILEEIKKSADRTRALSELYTQQHFPMCMVAARAGRGGSVAFADYLRSTGVSIATCIGDAVERDNQLKQIAARNAKPAVLDAYAAWTVAMMGSFDILFSVFPSGVVIPRSSVDELRSLQQSDGISGETMMHMCWRNGKYIRQDVTAVELEEQDKFIEGVIRTIEQHCSVEATPAPEQLSDVLTLAGEVFGPHVLDPAFVTARLDAHLISEDMYYRALVQEHLGVNGSWLQAILMAALSEKLVSIERYAHECEKLASFQHKYLSVDALTLFESLRCAESDSSRLEGLGLLLGRLGGENADLRSHLRVATHFLKKIWESRYPSTFRKRVTGEVVEFLIRHLKGDLWAMVVASLKISGPPELNEYLDGWVEGHFLPMSKVLDAQRKILT